VEDGELHLGVRRGRVAVPRALAWPIIHGSNDDTYAGSISVAPRHALSFRAWSTHGALDMPFANYKFPQGALTAEQKEEIIHRTTAMFVDYFGEGVRPYSMVLVDEVIDGGWGRADETITIAKLQAMQNRT
jgi:4-oxalocrotonate tautomerase